MITLCPTCNRMPSERLDVHWETSKDGKTAKQFVGLNCLDPIHDLADRAGEFAAQSDRVAALEEALRYIIRIERGEVQDYVEEAARAALSATKASEGRVGE